MFRSSSLQTTCFCSWFPWMRVKLLFLTWSRNTRKPAGFRLIGRATVALWLTPVTVGVGNGTPTVNVWTIIYSEWDASERARAAQSRAVRSATDRMAFWSACRLCRPRNRFSDQQRCKRRDESYGRPQTRGFVPVARCCEWEVYRTSWRKAARSCARKRSAFSSVIKISILYVNNIYMKSRYNFYVCVSIY